MGIHLNYVEDFIGFYCLGILKTGMNETIFHLSGPVDLMKINNKKIEVITSKNTFAEIDTTVRRNT